MDHVHGAVEVGTSTVLSYGECSGKLVLVTIIALVIAAILFGVAYFQKSDVNP